MWKFIWVGSNTPTSPISLGPLNLRSRVLNWRRRHGRSFSVVNFPNPQIGNLPNCISTLQRNQKTPVLSKARIGMIAQTNAGPKRNDSAVVFQMDIFAHEMHPLFIDSPAAVSLRLPAHTNYVNSFTKEKFIRRSLIVQPIYSISSADRKGSKRTRQTIPPQGSEFKI
jgi:hypothetical protein